MYEDYMYTDNDILSMLISILLLYYYKQFSNVTYLFLTKQKAKMMFPQNHASWSNKGFLILTKAKWLLRLLLRMK